jgi:hypothetical protein
MKRGKAKLNYFRSMLGDKFDALPTHERRAEVLARNRGAHSPFYYTRVLKRASDGTRKPAKRKPRQLPHVPTGALATFGFVLAVVGAAEGC